MTFTHLNLQIWSRGQMFYYFAKMAPTGYSLTVNMDVTKLRVATKERGLKFFPVYLWLVTKNLNEQIEFKVAEKDGKIGYYDKLTPLYADFHQDDKTFSLMWTEYNEDFEVFYQAYIENQNKFHDNHGVLSQPESPPPENAYTVSCIPWVSFEHFAVHSYENKSYYFPSVEAGKFFEREGKTYMPLSLTCHHATTDGYHVGMFLKSLQNHMDNFETIVLP
ncbi:MAG: chloramphenicol acetyltransferase CAT [Clostridiales bacterium]|nr:chloramphenicol acetyltransferase CAT [Clostridiales bacterium]